MLLVAAAVSRAADPALFPFVLPWDDASPGITNVSGLLDKPAGGRGFVVVKDGHLFEGDKRFRIFGVNTVFGASFPTHADAEKVAARMAKFGINCVRFHHMDNMAAPRGIWSADMTTLDPGQLDKLDYFIAQLKKNGIYADINLHVSRNYPGMPKWDGMPGYFKGVDNFYPPLVAMQHDYARQLLTHVNPYTRTAYVDEPAVAIIEINNENGLIGEWSRGSLDAMADPYRVELAAQWNRWLQTKYPAPDALEKAWNAGQEPLGAEMLSQAAVAPWSLEQQSVAKASVSPDAGALRISVTQSDPVGWHAQLVQPGVAFSKDGHYTVAFRARADASRWISVVVSQTHAPWHELWSTNMHLTPDWKDFRFTFQPSADEPSGRVVFSNLAAATGDCWLANVSLRPGGVSGLQKDEHPGAVPVFTKSELATRTNTAQHDWISFLYETESRYWTGMQQFLKHDLGAHSLIVGTAAQYSPESIQANLDAVDTHSYWQHPHFPGKPWDPANWTVANIPMAGAADGGTLPGLAEHRVAGKPYICTEYNEAAPNTHSSEAFLLLCAYAALQDWDGVFVFAYSHRTDDWDSRHICSYFDLDQHPTKLATLPAAVSMFVRGDVSKAETFTSFPESPLEAVEMSLRSTTIWDMPPYTNMDKTIPLRMLVEIDLTGAVGGNLQSYHVAHKVATSSTGELTWDTEKGRVLVNSPRSKAFIGKTAGDAVPLGDVTIEPHANMQDWAAITITKMGFHDLLITASGYAENTGMHWTSPEKNSVGLNWGTAPSLVEGIPATITLPIAYNGAQVWALDERGQRKTRVEVKRIDEKLIIEIGPQYRTLWYEVSDPFYIRPTF